MAKRDEEKFQKWVEETWLPSIKPELHNSAKALINDETARTELMNGFLRNDDYTKKTTELASARKELESQVEAERTQRINYEAQVNDWYQKANQDYIAQQQELAQLKAKHGVVPPVSGANVDNAEFVKQLEALKKQNEELVGHVRKVDAGTFNAVTALSGLAYKALKEGYSYDPNAILKISQTKGVPLDVAFNEFTAPERAEKEKAQKEAERAQMREELKKEILSNRPTPDAMGPDNPVLGSLFNRQAAQPLKSDYDVIREAVQDFNEGLGSSRG